MVFNIRILYAVFSIATIFSYDTIRAVNIGNAADKTLTKDWTVICVN